MNHKNAANQHFILFELKENWYAFHSKYIKQIELMGELTPLPNVPEFVEGIVFSRGQAIPVINLRKRLGLELIKHSIKSRMIVLEYNQETVGLVVDKLSEFITLPKDKLEPVSEKTAGLSIDYIDGKVQLDKRLILILRPEKFVQLSNTPLNIND